MSATETIIANWDTFTPAEKYDFRRDGVVAQCIHCSTLVAGPAAIKVEYGINACSDVCADAFRNRKPVANFDSYTGERKASGPVFDSYTGEVR